MTTVFRAHFDGKVFVPDEPVDLPVNQPLTLEVRQLRYISQPSDEQDRLKAVEELRASGIPGLQIPDEALRRENLYEDR